MLCLSGLLNFACQAIIGVGYIQGNSLFPEPLSKEEEKEYLEKLGNGDEKARNILIEHNLRLVAHIAKKYSSTNISQDDLISIGTIGLIKGINSYDISKNFKLATYVARCIENEILMQFRNQKKTEKDISISDPIETDSEGNPLTLADIISVDDNVIEDMDNDIKCLQLSRFVDEIKDERHRQIIILRYGLNGKEPLTQRETAQLLNISRSYVSRIEKRVLTSMRKKIENENVSKFYN